jgi:pilus assembly protein CpaE
MTAHTKSTKVVSIGDPGSTLDQISSALGPQDEFTLVDVLHSTERLSRDVRASEPDIVLIDYQLEGQPTLDIIDEIALQFPEMAIVAILANDDPVKAQQVMLAGARAFIIQPFTQLNLLSTLRRVRDLESRRTASQASKTAAPAEGYHPVKTIAVFSPRGGVGCSLVAANLALSLREETGQQVLLMEGKLFFGHLSVLLNLRAHNTLADLLPHSHNLEDNLIHEVVAEHASGTQVLLAPRDLQVAQGIRPDDLYNIMVGLQRGFDYLVIDAGSILNENTVTILDASDRILLVTNPELASLHDISRFIQLSHSLAYPPEKLLIVLNRVGMPGGVRQRDIETALHHPIFAQIPDDEPNAVRSINRGIPLVFRYPRNPVSRAIRQLAKSIMEINATEAATRLASLPAEKVQREALLASSRLG